MKKFIPLTLAMMILSPAAFADDYKGDKAKMIDTDGDGVVSQSEFMAAHEKRFSEIDADGNGELSRDEMKAHRADRRGKMKERRENRQEKRGTE